MVRCRIRRVKCDETRPQCLKCQTSRRICDGYLPDESFIPRRQLAATVRNLSTIGPVSRALLSPNVTTPSALTPLSRTPSPSRQDSHLFDVFRHHTAPSTVSFLPSDFWNVKLLQLAHNEPAIWHATVAVGALHRRLDLLDSPDESGALKRRAESHYVKALSLAKNLDTAPKLISLSLALMASSNLLGRLKESQVHILAGLRTARELRAGDETFDMAILERMISRMDLQAMTFSDSLCPYPFPEALKLREPDHMSTESRQPIQTYEQATSGLNELLKRSMILDEVFSIENQDEQTFLESLGALLRDTRDWESNMSRFESRLTPNSVTQTPALSVRLYHTFMRLLLRATMFGPEVRWDALLAYYERINTLAQELAQRRRGLGKRWLSLELGIVVPLFFAAHRCRHHAVRRRALALLQQFNCQEGMWENSSAVAAAKVIIAAEEGCEVREIDETIPPYSPQSATELDKELSVPWEAWAGNNLELPGRSTWGTTVPIAEENRVKMILTVTDFDKRTAQLKLLMSSTDPNTPFGGVRDTVVHY